jgi:predicted nucleotidyltransferase
MWMVECVTSGEGALAMSITPSAAEREIPQDIANLISSYKPRKVIIFGSRARGDSSVESDHDVLIIKETSTRRILRREEAMRGIRQTVPLDLLILTPDEIELLEREGSPFIREILDTGVVVYEQN